MSKRHSIKKFHILISSAASFLESTMASNNHTCEVREASDNLFWYPETPDTLLLGHMERCYLVVPLVSEGDPTTFPFLGYLKGVDLVTFLLREGYPTSLPLLGHLEGGYLVASLLRKGDPVTLPLLGHMKGGHIYIAVSLMREGHPVNLPLQATTIQGFP